MTELCLPNQKMCEKNMEMKSILGIGCIGALLLIGSGCRPEKKQAGRRQSVEVVTPRATQPVENKVLTGVVRENTTFQLSFRTGGQIGSVCVREGDAVRKGQVIARLDARDYELSVAALQAQYDLARREERRQKAMYDQQAVSGNEYDRAKSTLDNLEAQLAAQKNKLSYTELKAPADGCIEHVNMHRGEMVNAGTAIATLLDVNRMEVEVDMPSALYRSRESFGSVNCRTAGRPEKEFALKEMATVAKSDGNQLYKVKFTVADPDNRELTAGMNVEVNIPVSHPCGETGSLLPVTSVCKDPAGVPYIYVVDENERLKKETVTVIRLQGGHILVREQFPCGTLVVKAGVQLLYDGQQVRVVGLPSPTNKGGLI